jgi:hypothetical protein
MSAFPDRPRDFLTWLERQPCHVLAGVAPAQNAFVPRHLYGAYIRDLLLDARCGAAADRLILQRDGVVAIEDDGSRLTLRLLSGGSLRVDAAVVAGGNIPASPVSAPSRLGLSRTTRRRPPVCPVQRASIPDSSPFIGTRAILAIIDPERFLGGTAALQPAMSEQRRPRRSAADRTWTTWPRSPAKPY